MKRIFVPILGVIFLASCTGNPEGAESKVSDTKQTASAAIDAISYNLDTSKSTVTWEGYGVGHQHVGTLKLNNGALSISDKNISSGSFEINIASVNDEDIKDDSKAKLVGHLLSADFFDAAKYPTASFDITKCELITESKDFTHQLSGNLRLKDSTKNVSFPAKINVTESTITATAKFKINRLDWGMNYHSDKSLEDKFINPEVGISLNITANK